jgi:nucleotide-binding universal stress UspA family protein
MARTILVPLDGSVLAERALPLARRLAAADGGRLVLLWVLRAPPAGAAGDPLREVAPRREAEAYLRRLAAGPEAPPAEPVVLEGEAAPTILAEARRRGVDAIVLSTHGRSGIGRWLYGSVADAVMRHAAVPVLLVPAASAVRAWPTTRAPRLLVALDYSPLSEAVLPAAGQVAASLGAELILLSVAPQLVTTDPYGMAYTAYDIDADQAQRRQYLEGLATTLRAAGHAVKVRTEFGFVATTIGDVAREEDADLIALSTHGSGGATRLLMGSVATGVVQRAAVPVLVVRPAEVRQDQAPPPAAAAAPGAPAWPVASPPAPSAAVAR